MEIVVNAAEVVDDAVYLVGDRARVGDSAGVM